MSATVVVVDSAGQGVHIGAGAIVMVRSWEMSSVGMGCMIGKGASSASRALQFGVEAGDHGAGEAAVAATPPSRLVTSERRCGGRGADGEVTAELAKIHMEEAWKDLQPGRGAGTTSVKSPHPRLRGVPPGGPQVGAASHARRAPRQDGHPLEHVHAPLKHALSLRATGHRACVGASM